MADIHEIERGEKKLTFTAEAAVRLLYVRVKG